MDNNIINLKNDETVINLNPVFVTKLDTNISNKQMIYFTSYFLYAFFILEIIVLIILLYYFFSIEMNYMYNLLFSKNIYSDEDKIIYNKYMEQLQYLYSAKTFCEKGSIDGNDVYYGKYDEDKFLLTLDDKPVYFNDLESCKLALNIKT